jgi:hypothetical protein
MRDEVCGTGAAGVAAVCAGVAVEEEEEAEGEDALVEDGCGIVRRIERRLRVCGIKH